MANFEQKNLQGTKTEANLKAAFAGESQAHNKYTYFASKAKKDGYVQIAAIFEETAKNEQEHAKIWYKILNGGQVSDTATNLKDAAAGENYECTRDLRKPRGRRASPKWRGCSTQWRRSKRNTRNGIKSCFPTWKTGWYFPRTATRFGSAPTADISSSAKTRPSSAPSARIPKAISRYAPKIIDF